MLMFNSSFFFMLIVLLILLLLSNAVSIKRENSIQYSRIVMKTLTMLMYLSWNNLFINPLSNGIGIYGGLFHVTSLTQSFNIFIFAISLLILTLNSFYPMKLYRDNFSLYKTIRHKLIYNKNLVIKYSKQFNITEYSLIIIFILSGASFLISTYDLISIFLSIELQSYGLYIISALYRDSESATASGLTYFLLGGLSSCFILLGSGLLYVNSGTTSLENMYIITNLSETSIISYWYQPYYLHLSLIILSVGFLFKVSAAPFHFWSPDVYDGIPTVVTTYVAIIAKISVFVFLLELVYYTEHAMFEFSWKNILLISSMLSLVIGALLGLTQSRIKRLYAYSTINHVGFILLALSISSTESIQSYIFYILQYTLVNLNAFIILIAIAFSLDNKIRFYFKYNNKYIDKNNSPVQFINQIKGYFHINPFIALSLSVTLLSFAGIPPMIGFFGKLMVLSAALDSGYVFMALVAIFASVVSAGYYLNLIKEMFFFKRTYSANIFTYLLKVKYNLKGTSISYLNSSTITWPFHKEVLNLSETFEKTKKTLSSSSASLISMLTLILILFILIPEEWLNIVNILTIILFKL